MDVWVMHAMVVFQLRKEIPGHWITKALKEIDNKNYVNIINKRFETQVGILSRWPGRGITIAASLDQKDLSLSLSPTHINDSGHYQAIGVLDFNWNENVELQPLQLDRLINYLSEVAKQLRFYLEEWIETEEIIFDIDEEMNVRQTTNQAEKPNPEQAEKTRHLIQLAMGELFTQGDGWASAAVSHYLHSWIESQEGVAYRPEDLIDSLLALKHTVEETTQFIELHSRPRPYTS